jgi:SPP1 gp7 family putative phage head morphogenesis protein
VAAPSADPDKFEEAIRAHRRRVPVTEAEFEALTEAEQVHAFKVAGVAQARQVQEIFDAIDRAIEHGTPLDTFKADVGETLAEAWGGEDAPRVESIFRTSTMQAYNEGRDEIFDDPAVREVFVYARFDAVGDSRSCETCDPLDGTILPADDPFWATHKLPLHPSCRCVKTALTAEDAHEAGVDAKPPKSEPPAEGFGRGEDYEPDLTGFDPSIASILRDRLK